jgi:NADH-quinone oxidoreductase subunit E
MNEKFKLSAEGEAFVKKELTRYEDKRSAIIPSLYRVQKENGGWVSPASVEYLTQLMDMPSAWIEEVLTFYTMFNRKPVGKYHVQVCCNISCSMNGGRELADHLCEKLGVHDNEVTKDNRFSISRVECLGACDKAPMMQVNDDYHEGLTKESALNILQGLK